jgi:RNA polymerase sigma-70 factor (ECF subfamily)
MKEQQHVSVFPIGKESAMLAEPESLMPTDAWDAGWPQSSKEFEGLVDAFADRLMSYAFRRLGNIPDAEDVVQDVFVRAFAERSQRRNVLRVGPYLYRMVDNACTDQLRKHKVSVISFDDIRADEIPSGQQTPVEVAAAADEMRRAEELLRSLPTRQAEVIRLRVFDELRLSQIADVLGCSIDTVSSRLRYGLEKLRKIIRRNKEESR